MKVLEELGAAFAKKWTAVTLTPGLFFFLAALAIFITRQASWPEFFCWVQDPSALPQVILLLLGLSAAVVISGHIVEYIADIALLGLEGYWPTSLEFLTKRLVDSKRKHLRQDEELFDQLAKKFEARDINDQELRRYLNLQKSLKWMPEEDYLMPTKLGNVLRTAETRPKSKYGLDGVVLWPRLWFVLPDLARTELIEARKKIDTMAQLWVWGVLFWLFAPFLAIWFWVPIAVGSAVSAFAYFNIIQAARVYAELFDSIFDLYRRRVYDAIGWPSPKNPAEERIEGDKLTQYLARGSDKREPIFLFPVPPKS